MDLLRRKHDKKVEAALAETAKVTEEMDKTLKEIKEWRLRQYLEGKSHA